MAPSLTFLQFRLLWPYRCLPSLAVSSTMSPDVTTGKTFPNSKMKTGILWMVFLTQVCKRLDWVIHPYCQISNHCRLLMEDAGSAIAKGMCQLNVGLRCLKIGRVISLVEQRYRTGFDDMYNALELITKVRQLGTFPRGAGARRTRLRAHASGGEDDLATRALGTRPVDISTTCSPRELGTTFFHEVDSLEVPLMRDNIYLLSLVLYAVQTLCIG